MIALDEFFLTIVVPVYNVERYLAECLDSLLNQTVMRHKIIVVNDGSPDSSGQIAQEYARRYPRWIRYVEQENNGQGAALNTGLALVDTQFVTFLDSDDWQDRMFVETLADALTKVNEAPDLIFTLPWIYDSASKRIVEWYDKETLEKIFYPNDGDDTISIVTNAQKTPELYALEPSACRRIYRMTFLRQHAFRFPTGVKWEDVRPHFELLHKAESCFAMRSTGFVYRINTGEQTTSGSSITRMDMIPVFRETVDMALRERWEPNEIAYILRMLLNFTTWTIDVTNREYLPLFLKGMHELFKSIPFKYFKIYFCVCSPARRKEMAKTLLLRSPFYGLLADYWLKGRIGRIVRKVVKK